MEKRWKKLFLVLFMFLLASSLISAASYRSIKIWTDEKAGVQSFFLSNKNIAITELMFETNSDIADARLIIEALETKPSSLPVIANAYQYLAIGKFGIPDEDMKNIRIVFRVEKLWVENNSYKEGILAYSYSNKWEKVDAKFISEDDKYYYYDCRPNIFSYFVISGDLQENQALVLSPTSNNEIKTNPLWNSEETIGGDESSSSFIQTPNFLVDILKDNRLIFLYVGVSAIVVIFLIFGFSVFNSVMKGENISNLEEAKDYIEAELSEGVSKEDIEKNLVVGGWKKSFIDDLVHSEHLPPEIDVKIKAYVRSMINLIGETEIKQNLRDQGWGSDTVDEIVKDAIS